LALMPQPLKAALEARFGGLLRDQRGASAVEYGLIVLLIVIAVIAGLMSIGSSVSNFFTSAGNAL
jgi:pilus assembly protein Flp/PilA